MKYAINIFTYLMIVILSITSCTNEDILDIQGSNDGYITIEIPQNLSVTKAAVTASNHSA